MNFCLNVESQENTSAESRGPSVGPSVKDMFSPLLFYSIKLSVVFKIKTMIVTLLLLLSHSVVLKQDNELKD